MNARLANEARDDGPVSLWPFVDLGVIVLKSVSMELVKSSLAIATCEGASSDERAGGAGLGGREAGRTSREVAGGEDVENLSL